MTLVKNSIQAQLSIDKGSFPRLFSTKSDKLSRQTSKRGSKTAQTLVKTTSLRATPEIRMHPHHVETTLDTWNEEVIRKDSPDLMEKFYKAVQSMKESKTAVLEDTLPPQAATWEPSSIPTSKDDTPRNAETVKKEKTVKSASLHGAEISSTVSKKANDTAFLWMRRTTSCFLGSASSLSAKSEDEVACRLDRSPTEDILVMVADQRQRYNEIVKNTKTGIKDTQKQISFLRRQLDGVKKTNPNQKALMSAVDELDEMVSAARKLELKLKSLQDVRDTLTRKVYSDKAAQQALESLDASKELVQEDCRQLDYELFAKLAYAGLLKGYHE